jgi:seryl-tRNA(Sec) selenium transferase
VAAAPSLLEPYERLLAIAERECELVAQGRVLELEELAVERAALVAALPVRPPRAAAPILRRAHAVQSETSARLEEAMRAAGAELGRLGRGRGALRGYTPAGAPRPPRVSHTG